MCVDREEAAADVSAEQARGRRHRCAGERTAQLPGPCAHWDDQDADFIREILDLVGDKWSVLIIGTLADGPAATPTSPTRSPASPSACSPSPSSTCSAAGSSTAPRTPRSRRASNTP